MNAEFKSVPNSKNEMRFTENVVKLETGETRTIIIRSVTIPFWQACIKAVNTPTLRVRIAAVGTPGVGKTTSTALLIRMLLEQRQTVVYLIRSEQTLEWYYEFIPDEAKRKITLNVYPEKLAPDDIPSLALPSSYYIVDPGETKSNCTPPTKFLARVIIVPSPDSHHWGGTSFQKDRDGVRGEFRFYPTWSYEELILAWPILRPDMDRVEIDKRFLLFGGVPRHIFETNNIGRIEAQHDAIMGISVEAARDIACGKDNAFDIYGTNTKSTMLGVRLSSQDNDAFQEKEVHVISDHVLKKSNSKFIKDFKVS